jgi:predicted O-methyltransferase YrrM
LEFHREKFGWRRRAVFGYLGLRPPLTEHSEAEGRLLQRFSQGASCAVELGVAEGSSAWEVRQALAPDGTLHLVDPHQGRLGLSFAGRIARRLVGGLDRGRVVWHSQLSYEAVEGWRDEIDFLFIDGDHSYEGVSRDWRDWTPHVKVGGHVVLHDARLVEGWTTPETGPLRLVGDLEGDPAWKEVATADTAVVFERRR